MMKIKLNIVILNSKLCYLSFVYSMLFILNLHTTLSYFFILSYSFRPNSVVVYLYIVRKLRQFI